MWNGVQDLRQGVRSEVRGAMIKSANQYAVHSLFSHEGNVLYKIPPYQREYSWNKPH